MRVYRLDFQDPDMGCLVSWFPNKREATAALRRLQSERDEPQGPEKVTRVDLPTHSKGAMVGWLSVYLASDNG